MNVGGSVSMQAPGYSDPNCQASDIVVICTGSGQYVAFGAECNHECSTPAAVSGSELRCPRHGATWDFTGKLTRGPATADLPKLTVCADAMGVHVMY
jgi:nitrite reductase/ring-hydroxylating ferredoxin subunit